VNLLPEWATLQGGGLQKGGGPRRALGCQVLDVTAKKIFKTRGGRHQKSLLLKQSKDRKIVHSTDMGAGTPGNRCNERSNVRSI
jgi:hypothetical protein